MLIKYNKIMILHLHLLPKLRGPLAPSCSPTPLPAAFSQVTLSWRWRVWCWAVKKNQQRSPSPHPVSSVFSLTVCFEDWHVLSTVRSNHLMCVSDRQKYDNIPSSDGSLRENHVIYIYFLHFITLYYFIQKKKKKSPVSRDESLNIS